MRIHKLHMDAFGRFQEKEVELTRGLNVLYAPNESGKSTIAAFTKYMLYGFKSERVSKSNPLTTKTHYTPWAGGEPSGSMVFSRDGRSLTATRSGARACTLHDTLTGTPMELDREPGEVIYGVTVDTFESTAFFGQAALANLSMEEIEIKLKNMATGAEEGVSYDRARAALAAARNKIDNNRGGGALAQVRCEMEEIAFDMTHSDRQTQALAELTVQVGRMRDEQAQLEIKMQVVRAEIETENLRIEEEYAHRRGQLETQAAQAEQRVTLARARLDGADRAEADRRQDAARRLAALIQALDPELTPPEKPRRAGGTLMISLIAFALCGLCGLAVFGGLFGQVQNALRIALMAGGGLFLVSGIVLALLFFMDGARKKGRYYEAIDRYERSRNMVLEAANMKKRLSDMLGGAVNIQAAIEDMYADLEVVERETAQLEQIAVRLESLSPQGLRAESELLRRLDGSLSVMEQKSQLQQVEMARAQAQLDERMQRTQSMDVLESALNEKRLRERELKDLYDAYTIAIETLEKVHLDMAHLYAPQLADRTAEYFRRITGDTGRSIAVDEKGGVRLKEGAALRPLAYYSTGTADAVYVSLRLALLDMLYPDEKPTLIFDDSFSNFDAIRAARVMRVLGELGEQVQVLYCTCRDPEPILGGAEYTMVEW